jgi:ribose transport system substrate-binding protein
MTFDTIKLKAGMRSLSHVCCAAILVGLGAGAVASSAVSQEAEHEVMNQHGDITKMCGDKPAVVGHLDGFGGATWFKTTAAEFKDELMKCPNVKKVIYLDANNDAQKYNSNINSLVAQGANIIVAFTHFGDASLPAFKAATKAGVTVVPYLSKN